ncbi:heavy-metal-associated domain-containing protein, partial [Klebsiella pneumoniae]|uniref:heavy-metal-associated domain-containing protein n=1 Tax=Klebsiella pneumoniae TaxID=573 RepID=UPI001330AB51
MEFTVRGVNCQNCVRKATAALEAVPGLASALVSLDQARATVRWQPSCAPSAATIVIAMKNAGFEAEP